MTRFAKRGRNDARAHVDFLGTEAPPSRDMLTRIVKTTQGLAGENLETYLDAWYAEHARLARQIN